MYLSARRAITVYSDVDFGINDTARYRALAVPEAIPFDAVIGSGDSVRVRVDRIPVLSLADGAVVLLGARIIVIRTGSTWFAQPRVQLSPNSSRA